MGCYPGRRGDTRRTAWEAATIRRAMEEGKVYKFQSAGDTALFEREPDAQPRGC